MSSIPRRAWQIAAVYYAEMLEYRAEIVLWALSTVLPFILMGVWMEAGARGDLSMSPVDFARYFFAVFLTRQMTVVWVIYIFEDMVVQGTLSFRLLQPLDPAWHHLISHAAERLARLPIVALLGAAFFALYPASWWVPSLGAMLRFAGVVTLVFLLRFLMQYTFALLSFWAERASSLERLWGLAYVFLSGLIAPLQMYPEGMRRVAMMTPFPYLVDFPARLLTDGEVDLWGGLWVMGIWGAAFFVLNRFLWRRGLARYSGMGA